MADDTVAMSDLQERSECGSGGMKAIDPTKDAAELSAALKMLSSSSQPSTPQQGDACSTNSDGSIEQQGSRHGRPRRIQSNVGVDAAKQAAMSALAGLDMTTTKANLDASKAAAATARANGEVPTQTRKSSLRSVSCRQLGSSSASSVSGGSITTNKSVAFDDSANGTLKNRAAADARPAQWRGGLAEGQQPRTTRSPASRCVSLPHVLQGRVGMANRLAATYAQDAALQQQLQLLNGGTGIAQPYASLNQLQPGISQMDPLSMYQLQTHAAAGGAGGRLLAQQAGFAGPGTMTLDDSALPLCSNTMVQSSAVPMAGMGWPQGQAVSSQTSRWGSGQLPQQGLPAGMAQSNAQLMAQLQASSQSQVVPDTVWISPASSTGLQLSGARPQAVMVTQPTVSGAMSGMAVYQPQQLLAPGLQATPQAGGLAAGVMGAAGAAPAGANGSALLESYQAVSWDVLAAAQGELTLRDQLLTELVLLLTVLHTLNGVIKGNTSTAEALNDFRYLATAARRHMATFTLLSQAGNVAVQLLALITPLACRSFNSSELLEAAFLVLDTLALANRDVAAAVSQQRVAALTSLCLQVPVEQLVQQQALGLHWITSLAAAVSRNKSLLESMNADGTQGAAVAVGLQQPGISGPNMMLAGQQPTLLNAGAVGSAAMAGSSLSPGRKTPLATYFEETSPVAGIPPGAAAAGVNSLAGGMTGLSLGPNAVAGAAGAQLAAPLLRDALNMLPSAAVEEDLAAAASRGGAAQAHMVALGGLEELGQLALGVGAPQLQPGPAGMAATGAAAGSGPFQGMNGGLSLFGEAGLVVAPSGARGSSNPAVPGLVAR
eukprot:gene5656-5895_t